MLIRSVVPRTPVGRVASIRRRGYAVFPGVHGFERSVELLGEVPVVCAVLGTAAGGPGGRAILSHWSVMVDGISQVFGAGPPVVERSLAARRSRMPTTVLGLRCTSRLIAVAVAEPRATTVSKHTS